MNPIFAKILSEEERTSVETFISNKRMCEAVRKVLLAGIYYNGTLKPDEEADPSQNFILSWPFATEIQGAQVTDAEIGADVRAEVKAIRKVEQAFGELKKIKGKADKGSKPAPNRAK